VWRPRVPRNAVEGFRLVALALGAAYTCAIVRVVARISVFSGDDITTSWQGRTLPLGTLLFTPIDVHTVPMHRLVTYTLAQVAPLNDDVALAVMVALHAASVWLLYRALESIRHSATNAFVVACYATFVHLAPLFSWWVAAVHRLPYLCCLGGSVWAYARFRKRPSLVLAAVIVTSLLLGLGFFEKAVFVPFVLLGVEAALSLPDPTERSARAGLAALHGSLLAITAAFLFSWRRSVDPRMIGNVVTDAAYLAEYSRLSWIAFVSALAGQIDAGFWLGASALTVVAVTTCVVRPANTIALLVAGALVSTSLVVTGMSSARMSLWGLFWTRCWRYYPDVMYVFVLFAGIALSCTAHAPVFRRFATRRYAAVAPAAASIGLLLLSGTSYLHGTRAVLGDTGLARSRSYLDNVRRGMRRLEDEHARLLFVDGMVPNYLQLFQDDRARHQVLLSALGKDVRFTPAREGVYRIDPDGNIIDAQDARSVPP
jgi:hypothetical protein